MVAICRRGQLSKEVLERVGSQRLSRTKKHQRLPVSLGLADRDLGLSWERRSYTTLIRGWTLAPRRKIHPPTRIM